MNKCRAFLLLIIIFLLIDGLKAQEFGGYAILGSNLMADTYTSSGNSQVGSRIGLNTGLGGQLKVSEQWDLGMELLYSQNGIYIDPDQLLDAELERIRLHYLEIPLQLVYNPMHRNKNSLPGSAVRLKWIAGVSVARLFHQNITQLDKSELSEPILFSRPNSLLFHL